MEGIFILGSGCPSPDDGSKFSVFLTKRLNARKELHCPTFFQKRMWSVLSHGRSAVCISSDNRNGGKTLGYLVPLLNTAWNSVQLWNTHFKNSPVLVVLASGFRRVDRIWDVCQWLVGDTGLICQKLHSPDLDKDNYSSILNACHVLITTTPAFLRIAQADFVLNLSECKSLVLDSADQILQRFDREIPGVLEKVDGSVQLILSSVRCSEPVRNFYWFSTSPQSILLVYPWLEGLLFTSTRTDAMLVREDSKINIFDPEKGTSVSFIEHLKSPIGNTVIFCCDDSEADSIADRLKGLLGSTRISGEDSDVFVVTDQNFNRIIPPVNKYISWLIHYFVPVGFGEGEGVEKQFLHRGELLSNSLQKPKGTNCCRQTFIFTENHRDAAVRIVRYLKKFGAKVPDDVERWAAAKYQDSSLPLCSRLKLSGFCKEFVQEALCTRFRHKISKSDKRWPSVPSIGNEVAVEITQVIGGNHFFGRIVKSWNAEGTSCTEWKSKWKNFCDSISRQYEYVENQVQVDVVVEGQTYAMKVADKYFRVVVCEKGRNDADMWRVLSVDEGWQNEVSKRDLFLLPDCLGLTTVPQFVVEIILSGVRPVDKDWHWSTSVTDCIRRKIQGLVLRGQICLGSSQSYVPCLTLSQPTRPRVCQ